MLSIFKKLFITFFFFNLVINCLPSVADTSGPFEPLQFNNGISFLHPEEAYKVNVRFRMQNLVEYTTRSISNPQPEKIDGQVRRLRLRFNGWAASPKLHFQLQLSFSRQDMDWPNSQWPNVVRDANISYFLADNFFLSFGQAKLPGNRQRVVSSGELQFADRSIVNRIFNIDRDFGIQSQLVLENSSSSNSPKGIIKTSISTGEGRNLPFSSDSGLAYVGRMELLPLGSFKENNDYIEGGTNLESSLKISLASSIAAMRGSNRSNGTVGTIYTSTGNPNTGTPIRRNQNISYSDLLIKYKEFSFYSEFAYRFSSNPIISNTQSLFVGSGLLFQTSYLLTPKFELSTRIARIKPLSSVRNDPSNQPLQNSTIGTTYYILNHRVKLQSEITRESESRRNYFARINFELGI